VEKKPMWYNFRMTDGQLIAVFNRVKKWPKNRQRNAARILITMERQGENTVRHGEREVGTEQQHAEKKPKKLTSVQLRKYLQQQWKALAHEKDPKKKIIDFNKSLHIPGVPEVYLTGKAARELDRLVEEGVQEYLGGKTRKIGSLADLD
jgi:hypothetical protein